MKVFVLKSHQSIDKSFFDYFKPLKNRAKQLAQFLILSHNSAISTENRANAVGQ